MIRGAPLVVIILASANGCSHDWDQFAGPTQDAGPEGLILHLPIDETSGTTTRDTVSMADVGTLVDGVTFVPGVEGSAIQFDGSSHVRLELDEPIGVGRRFTLTAWVKSAESRNGVLLACMGEPRFMFRLSADLMLIEGVSARIDEGDWPAFDVTAHLGNVRVGAWQHYALTAHDGALVLYLDGTEAGTMTVEAPTPEASPDPRCYLGGVGPAYDWLNSPYEGALDDVRIYDRALSAGEVAGLASP